MSRYITRVVLNNIRGFGDEFELDLRTDGKPRMRTVIIGKNGTCKTTLLRCIALGLCWREEANALLQEDIGPIISMGKDQATVRIELGGHNRATKTIQLETKIVSKRDRGEYVEKAERREDLREDVFVCGLGAGRSTQGPDSFREYRIVDSVYSLFNYEAPLCNVELTFRRLRDFRQSDPLFYRSITSGILDALNLPQPTEIGLPEGGGVHMSLANQKHSVPLAAWADGHRLTMNWILDIFAWAMRARAIDRSGSPNGLILLDEIEQHTHPSLHIRLLDRLSKLLPKAQLFVTTHSPLSALGTKPGELISLRRQPTGQIMKSETPDVSSYSAADVLEDSRLFNTTAYSPETQQALKRYRELAQKPKSKRSDTESAELSQIAQAFLDANVPEDQESSLVRDLKKLRVKHDL